MTRTTHVNVEVIEKDESENSSQLVRTEKHYNLTPEQALSILLKNGLMSSFAIVRAMRKDMKFGVSPKLNDAYQNVIDLLVSDLDKLGYTTAEIFDT